MMIRQREQTLKNGERLLGSAGIVYALRTEYMSTLSLSVWELDSQQGGLMYSVRYREDASLHYFRSNPHARNLFFGWSW